MKILKRAIAFLITATMLVTAFPAMAATGSGPDIIVSDIKISNPYYKVGDLISISLYITNIGDTAMKLGSAMVQNLEGITAHGDAYMWSRPFIFPGETKEFVLNAPFEVTNENISFRGRCNTSPTETTEPAANQGNNYLDVSFTPVSKQCDLVIKDISVSNLNFAEGNVETFEVEYQNIGVGDIPYGTVEVNLSVNGKSYLLRDVSEVQAREVRRIKSDGIFVEGENAEVTADINLNELIDEEDYDNNGFSKTFGAVKPGKYGYTWTELPLGGGGWVRDMFIHPKFKDELFIGTDVNGVYRFDPYSKMNTQLFSCMEQEYEDTKFFMEMVSDYNNPNILFHAGGNQYNGMEATNTKCGIHRSFDGGKTWEPIPICFEYGSVSDGTNGLIAIDPHNSNILYSGSARNGLWKTSNALGRAVKWEKVTIPGYTPDVEGSTRAVSNIVFSENSPVVDGKTQEFYVSVNNVGVFKTTDGGRSFSIIDQSPNKRINNLIIDALGRLVVSCEDAGIYRYSQGEWTDITPVKNRVKYRMDVNPNNADMILAFSTSTLYLTQDGGISWKEIFKTSRLENKMPWHPDDWHKDHLGFVRFDPHYNNRVYYGAWFGAYRTMDITADEVVWDDCTYGIEELCSIWLAPLPEGADGRLIYGMCDCGCLKVDNLFEFPTKRINEPSMQDTTGIDFCERHPEFIARVGNYTRAGQAGRAAYSTDSGDTWTGVNAYPLKEDGVTWSANGRVAVASDYNENGIPTIIVNPANDYSYRSIDLGNTWTKITSLPKGLVTRWINKNQPLVGDKVNRDVFYVFDYKTGDFYVSHDNGQTFSVSCRLPLGDDHSEVKSAAGAEGTVCVSLNGNGLYYSNNYGQSFEKIENVNTSYSFDFGAKAPCSDFQTMYVFGTVNENKGVFRSTDLGNTWVKINDETQNTLWNRIEFIKADRRTFGLVYVASHGNGIITGFPSQLDLTRPRVGIYNATNGLTVNTKSYELKGGSTKPGAAHIILNGVDTEQTLDENNRYSLTLDLKTGANTITVYAFDENGNKSNEANCTLNYDPGYVGLSLSKMSAVTSDDTYKISGMVETNPKKATVMINNEAVTVNKQTGTFEKTVSLDYGINTFTVIANGENGKEAKDVIIDHDVTPPEISFASMTKTTDAPLLILDASLNEPGIIEAAGNEYVVSEANEVTRIPFSLAEGENTLEFKLTDLAGNTKLVTEQITFCADEKFKQVNTNEVLAYTGSPSIDGALEDTWVLNRVLSKKVTKSSAIYGNFGLMSDSKYLYIAAHIFDNTICAGGGDIASNYMVDSMEIYIDAENNKASKYDKDDQQIRFGLAGIPYSCTRGLAMPSIIQKNTLTEDGYIIEAAIPWSDININYSEGGSFGFEVSLNDSNDGGLTREGVICWVADGNSYFNTSKYGTAYIARK